MNNEKAAAPVQAQEPVLLQWRWRDTHPNTVTTGQFSEWETCDKTKYDEIVYYRDNGYPHYEVRKLFTHSAAVRPVPDDWTLMPNKLTQKMVSVLEFGRNQPAHNTYLNLRTAAPSAPVQPVAVPDGYEVSDNSETWNAIAAKVREEMATGMAILAAPAAQGDDHVLTVEDLYCMYRDSYGKLNCEVDPFDTLDEMEQKAWRNLSAAIAAKAAL